MFDEDDQREFDAQQDHPEAERGSDEAEQAGDIVPPPGAALVVKPPEGT